jgi:hypothetical protein
MKPTLYKNLRLKLIGITLVVSIGPLIILGAAIYHPFGKIYNARDVVFAELLSAALVR